MAHVSPNARDMETESFVGSLQLRERFTWIHQWFLNSQELHEVRRPTTWICLFDSMILALAEYGTDAIAEFSSPLLMFLL